jgi:hypothetical protein
MLLHCSLRLCVHYQQHILHLFDQPCPPVKIHFALVSKLKAFCVNLVSRYAVAIEKRVAISRLEPPDSDGGTWNLEWVDEEEDGEVKGEGSIRINGKEA